VATARLSFLKWGFAGTSEFEWRRSIPALQSLARPADFVPCAYADWPQAGSPRPGALLQCAVEHGLPALLIDTFEKGGRTLLDHLPLTDLSQFAERCRDAGIKLALAGSLSAEAISALRPLRPDWFAVRGAACDGGREGRVSAARVRELVKLLA
jgi:uncharacterized protein (UPF0264 family)